VGYSINAAARERPFFQILSTEGYMRGFCFILGFSMILAIVSLRAQVYSPWVLVAGEPDTRELQSVVQALYKAADASSERERAEAIWRYLLTDGRFVEPGMFYHIAGWAYEEPLGEVLDPLKLLNCYGFGLCYQVAPLLEALWEAGGFPDARVWFVTGHTVTEVFFDGKYNMLDSDMLGFTTVGDGDPRKLPIASVHQLENDENIILDKLLAPNVIDSSKVAFPWYPADVRAKAMGGYAGLFSSKKDNWLFPFTRYPQGHSMDFILRPGERMIRFYEPESEGLFYLPYKKKGGAYQEFPREIEQYAIRTEDGPHSRKDARMWATGRIEYSPPLWRKSAYYPVFAPGFNDNLHLPESAHGALARSDGMRPATAVFEMPSPYVLIDAEFALYAELATAVHRLSVETSIDQGRTWQFCGSLRGPYAGPWKTSPQVLTTSEHGSYSAVSGRYGYLVRFTLSGPQPTGQARIRGVKLTSLIQLNPRSLPQISTGANELVYRPGPQLRRWAYPVDIERMEQFVFRAEGLECVTENDNRLLKPAGWKKGEAVFELSAPDSSDMVKFQAGGRFLVLDRLAPEKLTAETRETAQQGLSADAASASIAWSVSPEGPFSVLWEYQPPGEWLDGERESRMLVWPEIDRTVENIPAGTKKLYLRYRLGGMGCDDIRLAVFTPAQKTNVGRLVVTHRWISNGQERSQSVKIEDPSRGTSYTVNTGRWGEVKNEAVIFECPSSQE